MARLGFELLGVVAACLFECCHVPCFWLALAAEGAGAQSTMARLAVGRPSIVFCLSPSVLYG